jgi:hypothetical protein
MAIEVISNLKPKNNGKFPVVEATDVWLKVESNPPDILQPNVFYHYGEVTELSVTLADEPDEEYVYEYMFEFIAAENFTNLTINPAPKWVRHPIFVSGKTYQVSILNGVGVIVGA